MGMVLSMEENEDPWWRTRSRSRECSRSIEDIASGVDQVTATGGVECIVWGAIDGLAQAPRQGRAGQGRPGPNQTRNADAGTEDVRANDQAVRRSSAWV